MSCMVIFEKSFQEGDPRPSGAFLMDPFLCLRTSATFWSCGDSALVERRSDDELADPVLRAAVTGVCAPPTDRPLPSPHASAADCSAAASSAADSKVRRPSSRCASAESRSSRSSCASVSLGAGLRVVQCVDGVECRVLGGSETILNPCKSAGDLRLAQF